MSGLRGENPDARAVCMHGCMGMCTWATLDRDAVLLAAADLICTGRVATET